MKQYKDILVKPKHSENLTFVVSRWDEKKKEGEILIHDLFLRSAYVNPKELQRKDIKDRNELIGLHNHHVNEIVNEIQKYHQKLLTLPYVQENISIRRWL